MSEIKIHNPETFPRMAAFSMAMSAVALYCKPEIDMRKGQSRLLEAIDHCSATGIEEFIQDTTNTDSRIGIWSGEHSNSVGIFLLTPHVTIIEVDEEGPQNEVFTGPVIDVFAHVDKHEPKTGEVVVSKDSVVAALFSSAFEFVKPISLGNDTPKSDNPEQSKIAVLERTQPPAGMSTYIGGKKIKRLFTRNSRGINGSPIEKGLNLSPVVLGDKKFGYFMRLDAAKYIATYAGLYTFPVDSNQLIL